MKPKFRKSSLVTARCTPWHCLAAAVITVTCHPAMAATRTKAATGTDLSLAAAWDTLPGSGDIAGWFSGSLGGSLTLGSAQNWGAIDIEDATAPLSISGSALTLSGGQTINGIASSGIYIAAAGKNVSLANNIALGANQVWTVGAGRTLTTAGVVSGAYTLTYGGAGSYIIGGINTNSGNLTIDTAHVHLNTGASLFCATLGWAGRGVTIQNGGVLETDNYANGAGYLWGQCGDGASNIILSSNGVFKMTGATMDSTVNKGISVTASNTGYFRVATGTSTTWSGSYSGRDFTVNTGATLVFDGGGNFTTSRYLSGGGNVTKNDAGTLKLTQNNTFTGTLTINGGTVESAPSSLSGNPSPIGNNTTLVVNSAGNLLFSTSRGAGYHSGAVTINGGTITDNGIDLSFACGKTLTFDTAPGTFAGSGQWRRRDANNKIAVTAAASGSTISVAELNLYDNSPTIDVADGANAADLTIWSQLTGTTLTKTGAGNLVLTNANAGYTSALTISVGALEVGGAGQLNSGSYAGNISDAGTLSLTTTANQTLSGVISGAGVVNKSNTGTLTLSGSNSFSGTLSVKQGTLSIATINDAGANGVLGNSTNAVVLGNTGSVTGTLSYTGSTAGSTKKFTLATGGTGAFDVATGGTTLTLGGAIDGAGNLTKIGAGTLSLSGSNTFSGSLNVQQGTLATGTVNDSGANGPLGNNANSVGLGNAGGITGTLSYTGATASSTKKFTLATGGTGAFDINSGTANLTLSGVIDGAGALTKTGAGMLTLAGANTYTGTTSVNSGTLAVDGSLASASAVALASGATLQGAGTINGTVTVASSITSNILGGNGTGGTLTLNNLTFSGSGKISVGTLANYTINPAVNVTGTLTLSGGAGAVTFALPGGVLSNGTYHLVGHGNTLADLAGFTVSGPTIGARQSANLTNNTGAIDYVVAGDSPYWTGATNSSWDTATTNWKLITSGTDTQYIAGDVVLFNDNAAGTTVDIAAGVSPATTEFNNTNKSYTLQGTAGIATGTLTKSGSGTLTINNANSYTGGTTLNGGTVTLGNNSALGSGTVALNAGTLDLGNRSIANPIVLGGGILAFNGATLTGSLSETGGSRALTVGANLTLTASNSFTGGTTITAGTLTLGHATNTLADSGAVTVNGGTLDLGSNSDTVGTVTLTSGAITGSGGVLTGSGFAVSAGTVSAVLGGTGALTKGTAGTVTLTGANTYTGGSNINAGTLVVATGGAIGTSNSLVMVNGGTLEIAGGAVTAGRAGGTYHFLAYNATGTFNMSAGSLTIGNSAQYWDITIGNTAVATYNQSGGTATFNVGEIDVGNFSGSGGTSINVSGGSFTVAGASGAPNRNFNLAVRASATVNISGTAVVTLPTFQFGHASGTASTATLNLDGGTLVTEHLTHANGTANVYFNGGVLQAGAASAAFLQGFTTAEIKSGGVRIDTNGHDITIAQNLLENVSSTGGGLTKQGPGTLRLSGTNTYTGATTVTAGTLALDAAGSIANSAHIIVGNAGSTAAVLDVSAKTGGFTIGSAQTLSGIGTVNADDGSNKRTVALAGGAVHAVGNAGENAGVGKQTIDGNLTYGAGSLFEWSLNGNTAAAGNRGIAGGYDAVDGTGTLTVDATQGTGTIFRIVLGEGVNLGDAFWNTPNSTHTWSEIFSGFTLAMNSGFDSSNIQVTGQSVSGLGNFSITGTSLTWTAVPEPTSMLAGLLLGAGLLRRRRESVISDR